MAVADLVLFLSLGSGVCGLVAVAAMVAQRIGADRAGSRIDNEDTIIDGGIFGDPDGPTPAGVYLEDHLREILRLQRPGTVAIVFALLGVVLAFGAGILSLTQ